ncbi:MAG: aspartate/tyrosine/aromatic aminotransferase [Pirellulaceae bacterium]|jgi:aspartate aminotransferase|nr:aspartate/tyrosine/aromatic aminotransferase [Pirellulaceae bacterium]
MFETLAAAPPDPILGLTDTFVQDPRSDKINLTIGVYRDESGLTPILKSVKQAEERLLSSEKSKGYLGIDGLPEFRKLAGELTLGEWVEPERAAVCQTPGGTGALRVAADFLAKQTPHARVWCSTPTWPNHNSIFESAGLETKAYPYLSDDRKSLDFAAMFELLEREGRAGDVLLLHACCHNPTGIDPTTEQWSELAELAGQRGMLPLIDFAYHGFGDGLDEDRRAIAEISKHHAEFFVCSSYSKNFGLYSERVGALLAVCPDHTIAQRLASNIKVSVRSNYSNPPRHGGAIVAEILGDAELREQWLVELAQMRGRIHSMRTQFVEAMKQSGCAVDFSFLLGQRGMFSYSGLTPMQVDWLRTQKGIYIVGSGRINVAGITTSNMATLTNAIAEALRT